LNYDNKKEKTKKKDYCLTTNKKILQRKISKSFLDNNNNNNNYIDKNNIHRTKKENFLINHVSNNNNIQEKHKNHNSSSSPIFKSDDLDIDLEEDDFSSLDNSDINSSNNNKNQTKNSNNKNSNFIERLKSKKTTNCKRNKLEDSSNTTENNKEIYKCDHCDAFYFTGQALGGHMSRTHPNLSVKYKMKKLVRNRRENQRNILTDARKELFVKYSLDYEDMKNDKIKKHILKNFIKEHSTEYKDIVKRLKKFKKTHHK